jgi:hypothetical protein
MAVNGIGVAAAASGAILLYAGIKGIGVGSAIRAVLMGQSPASGTPVNTISGTNPATTATIGGGSTGLPSGTVGISSSASANRSIGKILAASKGWTGAQWDALNQLIMDESGWRNDAQNPTSTAYGIGQFLDSTWASYGPKTSNPRLQIIYTLEYIRERYGTPANALAHENAYHWY